LGEASLAPARWVLLIVALVSGTVPFACLGIALGYWAPARAALPIANLLYLVLSYAGGLWTRPSGLPPPVALLSGFLPTRAFGDALVAAALGLRLDWAPLGDAPRVRVPLRRGWGCGLPARRRAPVLVTGPSRAPRLAVCFHDFDALGGARNRAGRSQGPVLLRRVGHVVGDQGRARARNGGWNGQHQLAPVAAAVDVVEQPRPEIRTRSVGSRSRPRRRPRRAEAGADE